MRSSTIVGILAALVVVAAWNWPADLVAKDQDDPSVADAAAQFYKGLNAVFQGDTGPMEQVWSHTDDVTYMGPGGGMQVGWEDVLANWKEQAAKRLGGQVKADKMHIHAGRDLAVACCYEVGENIVDGKPQKVSIRATNVFRKENGKWKMIGHHTDVLPFLEK